MPMVGTEQILAKQMSAMIQAELAKMGTPPPATGIANIDAMCMGIAAALIPHILLNCQVMVGIPTAGSPASQITIGPGTLT